MKKERRYTVVATISIDDRDWVFTGIVHATDNDRWVDASTVECECDSDPAAELSSETQAAHWQRIEAALLDSDDVLEL